MRRVVIVTGASAGLGEAVAHRLASLGVQVVLVARRAEVLEKVAAEILRSQDLEPLAAVGDVRDPQLAERVVDLALEKFGRLDGLVNNAGILEPLGKVDGVDVAAWRYNVEVNLLGPFHFMRAAIGALRKSRGRIVNVSSGAAVRPVEGWSAYCASKAGLTHLSRVVALEEPEVVTVSFRPGVVDTDMQASIRREGPGRMSPERVAYFESLKREGRLLAPHRPAEAIAWLVMRAPLEWSGELIDHEDARLGSLKTPGVSG